MYQRLSRDCVLSLGNAPCMDLSAQIPPFKSQPLVLVRRGGKVSLNTIVSSLLSPSASTAFPLSGCRTETSAKIPVAEQTDGKLWNTTEETQRSTERAGIYVHVTEEEVSMRERGHMCWSAWMWVKKKSKQESHTWEKNHFSWRIERLPTQGEWSAVSPLCTEDYIDYRSVDVHAAQATSMLINLPAFPIHIQTSKEALIFFFLF